MQQIGTISTNIWYSVGKDHAGIPTWSGAKGDLFFSATGLRFPGCGLGTIMSDFYVVKMQMMQDLSLFVRQIWLLLTHFLL